MEAARDWNPLLKTKGQTRCQSRLQRGVKFSQSEFEPEEENAAPRPHVFSAPVFIRSFSALGREKPTTLSGAMCVKRRGLLQRMPRTILG